MANLTTNINKTVYISDTTITNYLTADYANTILGQILRISAAHEIVQAKASELGLKILAGLGDTKPTSASDITTGSKFLDTASAINSIILKSIASVTSDDTSASTSGNNITINANKVATIPAGYYKSALTVTAAGEGSTLETTTVGANEANGNLLEGVTAYHRASDGTMTKVTGNITNYSTATTKTVAGGTVKSYTSGGKTYLAVPISSAGYYGTANDITTNILYSEETEKKVTVLVKTTATETIADPVTLPAGYYAKPITLTPNIDSIATNKVINIQSITEGNIQNGVGYSKTPDSGFDYFNSVTIHKPTLGKISNSNGTVTIKVTDAGYITTDDLTVTLGAGTYNTAIYKASSNTGGVTMLSESTAKVIRSALGYAPEDITISLPKGTVKTNGAMSDQSTVVITRNTTGYLPGTVSATIGAGTYNLTTTATTGNTPVDGVTISNGKVTIKRTAYGYAPATISATLPTTATPESPTITMTDNGNGTVSASGSITLAAGYYAGGTISISGGPKAIDTGSHDFSTSTSAYSGKTLNQISTKYFRDYLTAGYIGTDSDKYYEIKDAIINTTAGTTYKKVTTAGWISTDYYATTSVYNSGAKKTITPGNSSTTISAGTYIAQDVTIDAVSAGKGVITSTTSIKDIAYNTTTKKAVQNYAPSSDADTENNPTYFSSVDVDVTDIVVALMEI